MRRASILLFSVFLLGAPTQAFALRLTPPGKSGTDQYFETIPTSAGNAAPPQGGGTGSAGGGSGGAHALAQLGQGRAGATSLAHLGNDGQAAATLAAATAPANAAGPATAGGSGHTTTPAGSHGLTALPGESASRGIAGALTGSDAGGLGLVLPLLLGTSVIMAIGLAAWKLRRGGGPPELSV
ncbi:MAG: hypothetical protein ACR2JH_04385 [Solirubrobacteraceae bacterium]